MIGICLAMVVAANAVTASTGKVMPEYCIDYHPGCPQNENENSTATHIPYYPDCHKFYKCDHGRACLFSCPPYGAGQLVFNPELQVCDYPGNVPGLPNCEDSPSTPSTPTPSTPTGSTPGGNIPVGCLNGCPAYDRARIRHETECNTYYDCVKGKKVFRRCLENLYFNCYVQECDLRQNLPANYSCSDLNLG